MYIDYVRGLYLTGNHSTFQDFTRMQTTV